VPPARIFQAAGPELSVAQTHETNMRTPPAGVEATGGVPDRTGPTSTLVRFEG
jgi:hypothetical protein